jgi:hypothetical protein
MATAPRVERRDRVAWPAALLEALPLLFLGAVAAVVAVRWESIPDRFPVHWELTGQPDAWATRSASGVLGPLAAGFLLVLALVALRRLLPAWAARRKPAGVRAGQGAVLGACYALAAASGALAARPLLAGPEPGPLLVAWGLSYLFVPFFVVAALLRRDRRVPPPAGGEAVRALPARRRLWTVVLVAAALGAALVLWRIS